MAVTVLNAVHEFLTVARRGSFAAAAAELGVSPSALSQGVRKLEARLGVALLTRTTRSMALTDAGRRLAEGAAPGIQQTFAALAAITREPGELTGRVRLTVPEIALPYVIDPVVPIFAKRHPRVEIEVCVENRRRDIVAEGFDAGVTLAEFVARDMVAVRVTEPFRFVVVASPRYLERRGTPAQPKDLLTHDCVCYRSTNTGAIYPWELERGKKTWRIPARGPVTTNDERVVISMAAKGLGLAYVFEPEVRDELARGALQLVLEGFAASVPGFFIYFPSSAQVSPAFRAFMDVAREVASKKRSGARYPKRSISP